MEKQYSFENFKLKPKLLQNIYGYGFEQPNDIQNQTIPPILEGKDVLAQAKAGSGKTPCFVIGSLNQIDPELDKTQCLIVLPTRELAYQIFKIVQSFSVGMGIRSSICCGGERQEVTMQNSHVVIGTPGRLLDLLSRNKINIAQISIFVIDEVDELFNKGFDDKIKQIFQFVMNTEVQCLFFSATISEELVSVLQKNSVIRKDAVIIKLEDQEVSVKNITNYYVMVKEKEEKLEVLFQLLQAYEVQCIVYFNTLTELDKFINYPNANQFNYKVLHGKLSQDQRTQILNNFRKNVFQILVTTDLLARGIDIQTMKLVINYDFPNENIKYIHRVGRSARFGRDGLAISIITPSEKKYIEQVSTVYNFPLYEMKSITSSGQ